MKVTRSIVLTGLLATVLHVPAQAQLDVGGDLIDECARIGGLVKAERYPEARRAARDCLDALEQQLDGEVAGLFANDIAGWTRTSFDQSKAMGFNNTSANYEKGGARVEISLVGGSSMNAFGGLAAMGMMQQGGKQVRVANLPATVSNDGKFLIPLENGSLLTFESSAFNTADAALSGMGELVDAFPVAKLNELLKAGGE